DLALHTGHHTNHPHLTELTLQTPLTIPEHATIQLHIATGPEDPDPASTQHHIPITIHSRQADDEPWTLHATGLLSNTAATNAPVEPTAWPPVDVTALSTDSLYDDLATHGYGYGPTFQGLTAAWRNGDNLYAEIELDPDTDVTGYGIHPALLDAALHTLALGSSDEQRVQLPFSWSGVELFSTGATSVRAHVTQTDASSVSLVLTDPQGALVARIDALTMRAIDTAQLAAAGTSTHNRLFAVEWTSVASDAVTDAGDHRAWTILTAGAPATAVPESIAHLELDSADPDLSVPAQVHHAAAQTLQHLQDWLADPANTDRHLVVLTHGAVTTNPDENITDLTHAPLWGLIRSAQNEHPHRITLIDTDNHPHSAKNLTHAITTGEPQLAVRNGDILTPRLTRHTPAPGNNLTLNPHGTTLITGGTGTIGTHIARHLVTQHGARHLLLTSRSGPETEKAQALLKELTALGADVRITACDAADRQQLTTLLDTIPAEHPLTAVIHTAGVLDDATIDNLTPEHLTTVMAPKVDAAWNLHQLTADHNLDAFILFSSAAATLGATGQANYATANTFLDTLAHHRHHNGQPTTSLAWGYWAQTTGMTAHMDDGHVAKLRRSGLVPMTSETGVALFDIAAASGEPPMLLPAELSPSHIDADSVPPLMRGLVRPVRRAAAGTPGGPAGLLGRLSGLETHEAREELVKLVSAHVSAVLGHGPGASASPDKAFKDLGFDSLTAVELRNRLAATTGLRLPATLVFDHPSPKAVALHLHDELFAGGPAAGEAMTVTVPKNPLAELDRLDAALLAGTDDSVLDRVALRLTAVLARLNADRNEREAAAREDTTSDRLQGASSDELFDFIDKDLGRNSHA
ncbi:SDR family NAD(P)-dependent oxidoreductase, partial [Streptomyces sp. NPDC060366]|uniref:type I polyketide synthase n=1 Tax=Streptomyces sp. NPDC060366 TaxID=3347105 RepID=UPI0036637CD5